MARRLPPLPAPAAAGAPGDPPPSPPVATISWPGLGIAFFWQLGVLQHLEAAFDLRSRDVALVGSSAGALLSALAACNVNPQAALDLAHALCMQHGVFQRPLGLLGVWGGLVREWLEQLLPPDAAHVCSGRVTVVLTSWPSLRHKAVTQFQDRQDLIDCLLASSHVPWVMDGRATTAYRGQRCVDGSLMWLLTRRCPGLQPAASAGRLLMFNPWHDRQLFSGAWSLLRCVLLTGKEGAQRLLAAGHAHAAALDARGDLALLEPLRRSRLQLAAVAGEAAAAAAAAAAVHDDGEASGELGGVSPTHSSASLASSTDGLVLLADVTGLKEA